MLNNDILTSIIGKQKLTEFSRQLTDHNKLGNGYNIAPAISPDGSKEPKL